MGRYRKALIIAITGYIIVFFACLYFAFAAALSMPIEWDKAVSTALIFAPLGLVAGLFALPN